MTGRAELRVTHHTGTFVATSCRVEAGWVHVEGRWRRRIGANHCELRYGPLIRRTWPHRTIVEIRWDEQVAT